VVSEALSEVPQKLRRPGFPMWAYAVFALIIAALIWWFLR
jgi:hypothetical protein